MTDFLFAQAEGSPIYAQETMNDASTSPSSKILPRDNPEAKLKLDLSRLNDEALHQSTERAARDEQRACLILLEHLIEVERRRLYAKRIFPTLHDYVRSLGYTDGQTQERIMAARLLKKVPEAKEAFEAQILTLTTMAMVQRHSAREELPIAAVKDLVKDCENLSTRAVQKILVAESTTEVPAPDKIQPVSKKLTRITLEVDDEFLALLERAKELKGNPGAGLAELFSSAMKDYVKKRELKHPSISTMDSPIDSAVSSTMDPTIESSIDSTLSPSNCNSLPKKESPNKQTPSKNQITSSHQTPSRTASLAPTTRMRTRYVPAQIKNTLRIRSGDRCERADEKTGKRCMGRTGLEADHYPIPFAKGGPTTLGNLRWVCRAHNTEFAIRAYGIERMRKYLRP